MLKPGDWMCPSCGDHVFARKTQCRCGYAKPSSTKSGDWTCPKCFDNVFARKVQCRCGCAKPSERLKTALELVVEELEKGTTRFENEIPPDVVFALERQGYRCMRREQIGCGDEDPWDPCDCHKCRSNETRFLHWDIVKK